MKAKFFKSDFLQSGLASLTVLSLVLSILAPAIALPTVAEAATTVEIFADGFESGGFSNWDQADEKWAVSVTNAYEGSRKARAFGGPVAGVQELKKIQSVYGYKSIELSYWYKVGGPGVDLEGDDSVVVEYSIDGGLTWEELQTVDESDNDNEWHQEIHTIEGAEDQSGFQFRFVSNFDALIGDRFLLDEVLLNGEEFVTGTISGTKYNDEDRNGIVDGDDELSDWVIYLFQDEVQVASATTSGSGEYEFTGVRAGVYQVCEAEKIGEFWIQSYPNEETENGEDHEIVSCDESIGYGYQVEIVDDEEATNEFAGLDFGNFEVVQPEIPELISPIDGDTASSSSLSLVWDVVEIAEATTTYDLKLYYGTTTNPVLDGIDLATTTFDASSEGLPGGLYYWHARACEEASYENCSEWSEYEDFVLLVDNDTTAPRVEITNINDGDILRGEVDIKGIISDQNPAHYWLQIKNATSTTPSFTGGPGTVDQVMTYDEETHLYTWDTGSLEGEYYIKLEARDYYGQKSPDLSPVPAEVAYPDTDPNDSIHWVKVIVDQDYVATPTLLSPADNSFIKGGEILTNTWEEVPYAEKYYYESYHDESLTDLRWDEETTDPSKSTAGPLSTDPSAESTFWWRVQAEDGDGNQSEWSPAWKITIDNTAPTTTISFPTSTTTVEAESIEIDGVTNDNNNVASTTVEFAMFDELSGQCGDYSHLVTIINETDDSASPFEWSFSWTPEDGNYCLKAYGQDLAGNVEGTAIVQNVKFTKTVPPPVEEESSSSGGGSSGYRPSSSSDGQGGSETGFALPAGSDLALGPVLASGIGDPSAGGDGLLPDEDTGTSTDELSLDEENSDLLAAAGLFGSDNWWAWILLLTLILLGVGYYWYRSNKPGADQGGMF